MNTTMYTVWSEIGFSAGKLLGIYQTEPEYKLALKLRSVEFPRVTGWRTESLKELNWALGGGQYPEEIA